VAGSEKLLDAMTDVSRHLLRLMTRCLDQLPGKDQVSATQYRALAALYQRGPRNATVLAEELVVGRPAATKLVDRLARRRLIRRRRHPGDRRQVILEVTDRGAEIVRAVQHCRRRRLARVLGELDPEARDALERDLPALLQAFSTSGQATVARPEPVGPRSS
jgi:DNA-binding MarR family transcriptional regulator